jgi:hypothetical protein
MLERVPIFVLLTIVGCGQPITLHENTEGEAPSPAASCQGHSYYISPTLLPGSVTTGDDGDKCDPMARGTITSPWLTWTCAFKFLQPGDTLIVMDGVYGPDNQYPLAQCGSTTHSGTEECPITITAQHERAATVAPHLASFNPKGSSDYNAFHLYSCANWIVQGLVFEGMDAQADTSGAVVNVEHCSNITLRRLVARHTNRYSNYHGIGLAFVDHSLVEECEVYDFHRHGISASFSDQITFRRNYVNCNGYPAIAGQYPQDVPQNAPKVGSSCGPYDQDGKVLQYPDETNLETTGISFYPSKRSIMENNIVENVADGIDVIQEYKAATCDSSDSDTLIGNIEYRTKSAVDLLNRSDGIDDFAIRDNVAVSSATWDFVSEFHGVTGFKMDHFTGLGGLYGGIDLNDSVAPIVVAGSATIEHSLLLDHKAMALLVDNWGECSASQLLSFGNGSYNAPWTDTGAQCDVESSCIGAGCDPNANVPLHSQMGTAPGQCMVNIPPGNTLLKTASPATDWGANLVYRVENGQPTNVKLWDQLSGSFPCGAPLYGSSAGDTVPPQSCANVNLRLHVGDPNVQADACMIP